MCKIKYNSEQSIECLKARLVAFDNHHFEGIDYIEFFALIFKMTIIRTLLVVVVGLQLRIGSYIKWICIITLSYMEMF